MGEAELRTLRFAAIFHDIGKVSVRDAGAGQARAADRRRTRRRSKRHTVVGEQILSSVDFLSEVLPLVRHEHERWDGRGYPDGLAGRGDPAGRADRPGLRRLRRHDHRPPLPGGHDRRPGADELSQRAGTQFDERVVAALLAVLDDQRR